MSQPIDGYTPAFPECRWDDRTRQSVQWSGMTLQQWYAGKALTGLLSNPKFDGNYSNAVFEAADIAAMLIAELQDEASEERPADEGGAG